jgi:hypothetical protein
MEKITKIGMIKDQLATKQAIRKQYGKRSNLSEIVVLHGI